MKTLPLLIALEYSEIFDTFRLYFVSLIPSAISGSWVKITLLELWFKVSLKVGSLYCSVCQMGLVFLAATSNIAGL